ncbi:hypothetical protein ACH5A3_43120 [Streptomyces echinatus]|uniref:hypothetical protein n=1 Tax=Streptomyces echinatus TaxID=67293 RepID=UPI00378E5488
MFASCGQEAFFEGHVHALRTLGGVPRSKVRYDNLKAAVARVLGLSRARVEADRWIAFKSHYAIESFYCRPGVEGAHEKGGVEGQIGYFRRNHFVPVPEVSSLAELNELVEQWDRQDDARRIGSRSRIIAEDFALEGPLLMPLPEEPFESGRLFTPRVDRYAQIPVRTNRYSVLIRLMLRSGEAVNAVTAGLASPRTRTGVDLPWGGAGRDGAARAKDLDEPGWRPRIGDHRWWKHCTGSSHTTGS